MRQLFALALGLVLFAVTSVASAHGMRSVVIEIDEVARGNATIHMRSSVAEGAVEIAIEGCSVAVGEGTVICGDRALEGHAISAQGLGPVVNEAVVWMRHADGTTTSHVLTRDKASWVLPSRTSAFGLARQYVRIGVIHILTGADHLLFLFVLVLSTRRVRTVLLAETAFTLSHSISFTATALGWLHISSAAAETCIALSLLLVALDVERRRAPPGRLAAAGLAFVFGLVHGLGFAGGFFEIGLPDHDAAFALVGFGAGVELGQLAFLAAVLLVVHFARQLRSWRTIALLSAYSSGAISAWWLIERAIACVSGG